jgi:hypothetical protein
MRSVKPLDKKHGWDNERAKEGENERTTKKDFEQNFFRPFVHDSCHLTPMFCIACRRTLKHPPAGEV